MPNHPNRGNENRGFARPKTHEIRALRLSLGMTPDECGALVCVNAAGWLKFEHGDLFMHAGLWKLFRLLVRDLEFGQFALTEKSCPEG